MIYSISYVSYIYIYLLVSWVNQPGGLGAFMCFQCNGPSGTPVLPMATKSFCLVKSILVVVGREDVLKRKAMEQWCLGNSWGCKGYG